MRNLSIVVTSLANAELDRTELNKTLEHFTAEFKDNFIIIDDSGLSTSILEAYYGKFFKYVIANKQNYGSLQSRREALKHIRTQYVRYIDAGDQPINNESFINSFKNVSGVPWLLINQANNYGTIVGNVDITDRMQEFVLGQAIGSTVWTKVYNTIRLRRTYELIPEYEYINHCEDYLINCLYSTFVDRVETLGQIPFIRYHGPNISKGRTVTVDQYNKILDQVNRVKILLYQYSYRFNLDQELVYSLINYKVNKYMERFTYE